MTMSLAGLLNEDLRAALEMRWVRNSDEAFRCILRFGQLCCYFAVLFRHQVVLLCSAGHVAEASAKSLAQDVFITDLSEKFAELRRQIQEDTQRLLQPMCRGGDGRGFDMFQYLPVLWSGMECGRIWGR